MKVLMCYLFCFFSVANSDYYDLLGISKDADNREIRRAFKKLALKLHPDKNRGEADTHEQFLAINKAYEVLKDEETRKNYDLYGEDSLKQQFGNSWKGNYHSWNYYYESFGIYDDDPEIVTLNGNDFAHSVLESSDLWFINFYSPQCSHCHHLAPVWREIAHKLENVIQIGAVNCEEDWRLCRQQNIYSYPSLVMYPNPVVYRGSRDAESLIDYVLQALPYNVVKLNSADISLVISLPEYASYPWLIFTCQDKEGCIDSHDLKKLGVILENIVNVAFVDQRNDKEICKVLNCKAPASLYFDLKVSSPIFEQTHIAVDEFDFSKLIQLVLSYVPEPEELNEKQIEEIKTGSENGSSDAQLLFFTKNETDDAPNIDLKRLQALLSEVPLSTFYCDKYPKTCSSMYVHRLPRFILFRPGGSYEFHYGKITIRDIVQFAKESLSSRVHTLTPEKFNHVIESGENWFIDFFSPSCPPCLHFLPIWRKTSQSSNHLVKFGSIDCTIHLNVCRQQMINAYPTAILYNNSVPHKYYGPHSQTQIDEFVKDILNPSVVSLSPISFESSISAKSDDEIWVVDFFMPSCSPCQRLAPEWRKLAKLMKDISYVNIGEINCQVHQSFCSSLGVHSYPTIRLYPRGESGKTRYFYYKNWNSGATGIQDWIYNFLPSKSKSLTSDTFHDIFSDSVPWLIDYYTPWCSHCQTFTPVFERISVAVDGIVKTGKVNCEKFPNICAEAKIRAYPTVMLYEGQQRSWKKGIELNTYSFEGIVSFLENRLNIQLQRAQVRDEL